MAHVVMFDRLAFQRVKLDKDGNRTIEPDGPEEIVTKGNYVPDYVPDWQLNALAQSGMIVGVADHPVAPDPVEEVGPVPPAGQGEPSSALKPTDSRADWEAFATSPAVGMNADEAASFPNKAALIDAVTARTQQ